MGSYAFGFDFGTLSCRGIAIDLETGQVAATAEEKYAHGVINGKMYHADIPLQKDWNLQDPMDWLFCICQISKRMLKDGNIRPEEVKSIGTDFTSCTLLPVKKDGTPLCELAEFRDKPNAWPKLWKHHGAQKYAEEIEAYAKEHTTWLKDYFGGAVSSEWVFPKLLQVLRENPEIYDAADYFMEAVDYIVMALTGRVTRCSAALGVNCFWVKGQGYPDPGLTDVTETKLAGEILTVGDPAGHLTEDMAARMGLTTEAVVAAGHSDGAVAGCGAGVTESGSMILVMGTSTCHQMMYKDYHAFEGLCSIAADGMVPGLYGYESGQPATGDIFQWFADTGVPERYYREAEEKKQSISTMDICLETEERTEKKQHPQVQHSFLVCALLHSDLESLCQLSTTLEEMKNASYKDENADKEILILSESLKDQLEDIIVEDMFAENCISQQNLWILEQCITLVLKKMNHTLQTGQSYTTAKTSQLQENSLDFKETVQACFSELCTLSDSSKKKINPLTFSLRTLRICLVLMEDGISPDCSLKWMKGGMMLNGRCLTPKISECHKTEKGASLSDILEGEVQQKYFLSKEQTEKIVFK